MNKFKSLIIMVFIILMVAVSWKNVIGYHGSISRSYKSHIEKANEYIEKKIYIDAVGELELALQVKSDDYATAMRIIDLYKELRDEASYVKACEKAIDIDPSKEDPYVFLADYYIENAHDGDAMNILRKGAENLADTSKMTERIISLMGDYIIEKQRYETYFNASTPNDMKKSYIKAIDNGKYALLDTNFNNLVEPEYDDLGLMSQNVMPVCKDGDWYYVDENEYRKLVPESPADYLGTFNNGYAPAKIGKKYGYIDTDMKEYKFEYDYAGCFSNGIAAVQQGKKWAIINNALENVTDFTFDEIMIDDYGFCSSFGVFFARTGKKFYLYDVSGNQLSEGFDDVKMFASEEPAAVKSGDKWGFIDLSGNWVIQPKYEDADSFCVGYAPFCRKGEWGCIDIHENVLIPHTFKSMKAFSPNGRALVEVNDQQQYIVVNIYE